MASPGTRPPDSWTVQQRIPIPNLHSHSGSDTSTYFTAVVTVIWPFSTSQHSLAILLADPDFRHRDDHGQVKCTFIGHAANAILSINAGSGDQLNIALNGGKWVEKHDKQPASTPGQDVGYELEFKNRLRLQIIKFGEKVPVEVDVDEAEDLPLPERSRLSGVSSSLSTPASRRPFSSPKVQDPFETPGLRVSRRAVPELDEDDPFLADSVQRSRKRVKLWRNSGRWKSTDAENGEAEREVSEEEGETEVTNGVEEGEHDIAAMADEGGQRESGIASQEPEKPKVLHPEDLAITEQPFTAINGPQSKPGAVAENISRVNEEITTTTTVLPQSVEQDDQAGPQLAKAQMDDANEVEVDSDTLNSTKYGPEEHFVSPPITYPSLPVVAIEPPAEAHDTLVETAAPTYVGVIDPALLGGSGNGQTLQAPASPQSNQDVDDELIRDEEEDILLKDSKMYAEFLNARPERDESMSEAEEDEEEEDAKAGGSGPYFRTETDEENEATEDEEVDEEMEDEEIDEEMEDEEYDSDEDDDERPSTSIKRPSQSTEPVVIDLLSSDDDEPGATQPSPVKSTKLSPSLDGAMDEPDDDRSAHGSSEQNDGQVEESDDEEERSEDGGAAIKLSLQTGDETEEDDEPKSSVTANSATNLADSPAKGLIERITRKHSTDEGISPTHLQSLANESLAMSRDTIIATSLQPDTPPESQFRDEQPVIATRSRALRAVQLPTPEDSQRVLNGVKELEIEGRGVDGLVRSESERPEAAEIAEDENAVWNGLRPATREAESADGARPVVQSSAENSPKPLAGASLEGMTIAHKKASEKGFPFTADTMDTISGSYIPLVSLPRAYNKQVDMLVVISSVTAAERAPKGPRDWILRVEVVDPTVWAAFAGVLLRSEGDGALANGSTDTSPPRRMLRSHRKTPSQDMAPSQSQPSQISESEDAPRKGIPLTIFRPHKVALPHLMVGDVILLQGFKVQTQKRHRFCLLSEESSAWGIWVGERDGNAPGSMGEEESEGAANGEGERAGFRFSGPAVMVEDDGEERDIAMKLRGWWRRLVGMAD